MTELRHYVPQQLYRRPQGLAPFEPGDPSGGYYNDLTVEILRYGPSAADGRAALAEMVSDRRLANPIDIAQLGLGALQQVDRSREWLSVARAAAEWLAADLDADGRLAFLFAMPHTFPVSPPWYSAMAQGEAASLLVRAAAEFGEAELARAAVRASRSLLDSGSGLVSQTDAGPVLQEYPTEVPSHVLNGWMFALWGLYDVGRSGTSTRQRRTRRRQGSTWASTRFAGVCPCTSSARLVTLRPLSAADRARGQPFLPPAARRPADSDGPVAHGPARARGHGGSLACGDTDPLSLATGCARKIAHRIVIPRRPVQ